ncbi:hypothetical protein [Streptomyces neyagawaensis]|uniref:hypothetical protein n=1 Tax=Streptomyces neyagawaensis TaxID=42238 RepID=UPI0006E24AF0|nr:hypothetical protein [Streptomyces neyagawaensis]MCL6732458.1 hypothetical protein [Streptomyces neyagawaensis]MDE1687096.1 hypothetical protein [Streptomyces neyagawaensis]
MTCGRKRWLDLAEQAAPAENAYDPASVLDQAWVVQALCDGDVFYSCGTHLLGEADVAPAPGRIAEPERFGEWLTTMDTTRYHLLTEQPARGARDGEGFRISPDAPR